MESYTCDSCGGEVQTTDNHVAVIFSGVKAPDPPVEAANGQKFVPINWDGETLLETPFTPTVTLDLHLCDDCERAALREVEGWHGANLKAKRKRRK